MRADTSDPRLVLELRDPWLLSDFGLGGLVAARSDATSAPPARLGGEARCGNYCVSESFAHAAAKTILIFAHSYSSLATLTPYIPVSIHTRQAHTHIYLIIERERERALSSSLYPVDVLEP